MIIEFEGRQWQWDPDSDVTVKEATVLRLAFGMSLSDWLDGLKQLDERSWTFQYWLLRKRNGIVEPIADLDFGLLTFVRAYADAAKASGEGTEDLPELEDPKAAPQPSPMTAPLSPAPPTPMTTTPQPPGQEWAGTGFSQPMSPSYGAPISSSSPTSVTYPPQTSTP